MVELILTNENNKRTSVDVLDSPFRLNRNSYTVQSDRLKILGGVFSTAIKLARTKKNNQFFLRNDWKSNEKFYKSKDYPAILSDNGLQIAKGVVRINSITNQAYEVTFFDQNISWLDDLSKFSLKEIGYVNGNPTWLQDFNGAIDFDNLNVLTNRETDIICPTIVYNNTPLTDFMRDENGFIYTDDVIWGLFEEPLANPPVRLTQAFNQPNDFVTERGYFGIRYGLTFEDFPPAVYYRNVIEKIFEHIGLSVDCSIFYTDWFNRLYMPYVGSGYLYNWKNLATVHVPTLAVSATNEENFDGFAIQREDDDININYAELPPLGGGAGTPLWIDDYIFKFVKQNVIKHDDYNDPTTIDKIVAYNKFNQIDKNYVCPADGTYKISINTDFSFENPDAIDIYDGNAIWLGQSLFNNFGSWDVNSNNPAAIDNHYAWDDNVLIIQRYSASDDEVYGNTVEDLYRWMNGENKNFIDNPNDVIAYFSPKRKWINDNVTPLAEKEYKGSPLTNNESEVIVNSSTHVITSTFNPISSESSVNLEVTLDMKKNEKIRIYWTRLSNINGQVTLNFTLPKPYSDAYDFATNEVNMNISGNTEWDIEYLCGEYDLDIAKNLPNINAKNFIASFIKQFNLWFKIEDKNITFLPLNEFLTKEAYDITDRVIANDWETTPVPVPKNWYVGYSLDENDNELFEETIGCINNGRQETDYANVTIENNDNIYAQGISNDYNEFSPTKFIDSTLEATDYSIPPVAIPISTDPVTGITIKKGFVTLGSLLISGGDIVERAYTMPSIQSTNSVGQRTVGDLTYDYNYTPRLLYHLGLAFDPNVSTFSYGFVDSARGEFDFITKKKHWYIPTLSAFDKENNNPYPTLRYDTDDGLYNRYFVNLVDFYNKSDILTLKVYLRPIDWVKMDGSQIIRFNNQAYRLMSISDYDPTKPNVSTVKLLKIV
jgi:hypothetical protein